MAYKDALSALTGGGQSAAMGAGLGAPPQMPGLPPPPTGAGGMPSGMGLTDDKKASVDDAILRLRTVSQNFPQLKSAVDAFVDVLKSVASGPAVGAPPAGAAAPPGSPVGDGASLMDSGQPGTV